MVTRAAGPFCAIDVTILGSETGGPRYGGSGGVGMNLAAEARSLRRAASICRLFGVVVFIAAITMGFAANSEFAGEDDATLAQLLTIAQVGLQPGALGLIVYGVGAGLDAGAAWLARAATLDELEEADDDA